MALWLFLSFCTLFSRFHKQIVFHGKFKQKEVNSHCAFGMAIKVAMKNSRFKMFLWAFVILHHITLNYLLWNFERHFLLPFFVCRRRGSLTNCCYGYVRMKIMAQVKRKFFLLNLERELWSENCNRENKGKCFMK